MSESPAVLPPLRAEVDTRALARNLQRLQPGLLDLSHDGWGHGAGVVADVAAAAGWASAGPNTVDMWAVYGLRGRGEPVLSLHSGVLSTKPLRAGDGVSYGYRYRARGDTISALVAGGYAQGIVRALGGEIDVCIAGSRHRVVGRIAMDVCVVDTGPADSVRAGDEVIFFGRGDLDHELGHWARLCGDDEAVLTTRIGRTVPRVVVA